VGTIKGTGVAVSDDIGEETGITVFSGITDISLERAGGKFDSGLVTPRLHALSMNVVNVMKNNRKKHFLIRMVASILNKKCKTNLLRGKKIIALKKQALCLEFRVDF